MLEYLCLVRNIQERFEAFDLSHVPRSGNTHADLLATLATSSAQDLPRVILVEDLYTRALTHQGAPRIHQITLGPSWMDAISPRLSKSRSYVGSWEIGGIVDRRIGSWIVRSYII